MSDMAPVITVTAATDEERIAAAHEYLLHLGQVSVEFSKVKRAPHYEEGRRENDVEHSFHLALTAVELANLLYPGLDRGLISQFGLVHDLPEIYTGDVWTFDISEEDMAKKRASEAVATERLLGELPPYTADLLRRYEEQNEAEARFVRYVDKLLPVVINIVAGKASTFLDDYGIASLSIMRERHRALADRFEQTYPEFTLVHSLLAKISDTFRGHLFPQD